jgi:hypothetical protein
MASKAKIGFHVGAKVEYSLSQTYNGLYIYSGALFSLKGGKKEYGYYPKGTGMKDKESNYFLEVPVHLGYRHAFNKHLAIFGTLGPYMGVGLFGKYKVDSHIKSDRMDVYGSEGYLNRFDFGLGAQVGIEISRKVQFALGYDRGLKDMIKAKNGEYKNRNFKVSCAYIF